MIFGSQTNTQPQSVSSIEPAKPPRPPQPVSAVVEEKPSGIGKTIAIIILAVTTVAFAGLFVWKFLDWMDASTNLQNQIDEATDAAVLEKETQMEAEFAEREKEPNTTFAGPADYGSLTFAYPKTWSLFVASDAAKGGEFTAYMHPLEIPPINSNESVIALRISIKSQAFDNVVKSYDNYVKSGKMTMNVVNINQDTATANVYRGSLTTPTGGVGIVAIMKIRDKTAILQTDSMLFEKDFNHVLETISFNS